MNTPKRCKACKNDSAYSVSGGRYICACGADCGAVEGKPIGRVKRVSQKEKLESLFIDLWDRYRKSAEGQDMPLYDLDAKGNHHVKLVPGRKIIGDFTYVEAGVNVEIDGGKHAPGGGRHNTSGDRWRNNAVNRAGWVQLHYDGDMLKNEGWSVVQEVAAAIREGLDKRIQAMR